tara:strand:- start:250 stop:558 length:309 start_codon:yes stop_codon:yes gene_type:complete
MGKMKELDIERERMRQELSSFSLILSTLLMVSAVFSWLKGVSTGNAWLLYFGEYLLYFSLWAFAWFVVFRATNAVMGVLTWIAYRRLTPSKDWLDDVELEDL